MAGCRRFPNAQIQSVIALCRDIAIRHAVLPERFLAHSDIAPSRKRDPGENFPWRELAQAGVGRWEEADAPYAAPIYGPGQEGPHVRALQTMLALYGYEPKRERRLRPRDGSRRRSVSATFSSGEGRRHGGCEHGRRLARSCSPPRRAPRVKLLEITAVLWEMHVNSPFNQMSQIARHEAVIANLRPLQSVQE